MKKNSFTLIELLIVITIIGLTMTFTMRFGADFLQKSEFQSQKERFKLNIDQAILNNFFGSKMFGKTMITRTGNKLSISGENLESSLNESFTQLIISGWQDITLSPGIMGCQFAGNSSGDYQFKIIDSKSNNKSCIKINSKNCKISEEKCINLP